MTAYPNSLSPSPALSDERTLESAINCLTEHLPITMKGSYSVREMFEILVRCASRGDSIEQTVRTLEGAPSGNDIRYHLEKFEDMAMLEEQLNGALHSRIPPKVAKGRHRVILDLHLIPDYGVPSEADASYVYRSQAKAGTTRCFAYATVYVICRNKRVTLGIHAVLCDETLVATVTYLVGIVYVVHQVKVTLHQLHDYYRQRFGIETSYRIKNHCRIRTTPKNPVLRLLFVALAFILVNLWVYLLWYFVSCPKPGKRVVYQNLFPLKTMLEFLAHAVERRFPVITAVYLPLPH